MGTIIQDFGPIYGEPVNGTVQGRPNGSVYVPSSNIITLTIANTSICRVAGGGTQIGIYNPDWKLVAVAQDLSSYMQRQVFSDSDCTVLIASTTMPAGIFNYSSQWYAVIIDTENPPEVGDTVYVRAQLFSGTAEPVATSEVVSMEVVS